MIISLKAQNRKIGYITRKHNPIRFLPSIWAPTPKRPIEEGEYNTHTHTQHSHRQTTTTTTRKSSPNSSSSNSNTHSLLAVRCKRFNKLQPRESCSWWDLIRNILCVVIIVVVIFVAVIYTISSIFENRLSSSSLCEPEYWELRAND